MQQMRNVSKCQSQLHSLARSRVRVRRQCRVVIQASSTTVDTSLYKLPLFASSSALLPSRNGVVTIFEPRYLKMFEGIMQQQDGQQRFGHIIHPSHAPPQLLVDASIAGWPKVGVLAQLKSVSSKSDGTLVVSYEGVRRFQILSMLETEPYATAYCMNMEDHKPDSHMLQQELDQLEIQVYKELQDVVRLNSQLGDSDDVGTLLPDAIDKYAPTPSKPKALSDVLIDAGWGQAGHSIAMWQSQGSVYGKTQRSGQRSHDPYQLAANRLLGDSLRQELFSFAAASCLELGNPERLALLNSRDTAARLAWVRHAITPFRAELQAKAALSQALGSETHPDTGL